MAKKTFYDVLQVSRNADPGIIKAAYMSLVQRYHPDKNPDNQDAEKNLKIINRSYDVLSDPVKRAGYDAALAEDDGDRINQADAAASSNESKKSQTASRAGNDAHLNKATERAASFNRSTTLTKKRDYLSMLDLLPMAATADFFKSLVLTGFHGSPEASGWTVFFSMLLGGAVGYPLCHYARTKITKNVQNRRTVIFLSLSISLGLSLAILTTTVLLTKSASRSAQNTVVPASRKLWEENYSTASPNTALQQTMALAGQGNGFKPTTRAEITAELVGTWECQPLDERSGNGVSTLEYKADGTMLGQPWYVGDDLRLYEKNVFSNRADGYLQFELEWGNGGFVRTVTETGIRLFCEKRIR